MSATTVCRRRTVTGAAALAALLAALLVALLVGLTGCGSATDDAASRRELDAAGRQVVTTLNELVPLIGDRLHTKLAEGTTDWESCTLPVTGNAQASARLQFGVKRATDAEGAAAVAAMLRERGWHVAVNPKGSLKATKGGLTLMLTLATPGQVLNLQTACVETSTAVDKEYDGRDPRRLPAPWPADGIS